MKRFNGVQAEDISRSKQSYLGTQKVGKLLMEFSIPATIGMLVNALYNIVARIFIGKAGNLSSAGLAALTVSFPIMMIMMGLALLFGAGGAALFSIKLGEKDREGAGQILGNAIAMILISSIAFMVIALIYLEPLLRLFGASEDIMPLAMEYMRIILYASILQGPAMGCNHFMRADGSPKSAMTSMFIGAGFNIVFDYVLIIRFQLGMTGAALSTIGAQGLSALWGLSYLIYRGNVRLKLHFMRIRLSLIRKIMFAGLPSFTTQITGSLLNIVLNNQLGIYGGDIAISGMGAIGSLQQFMIMPLVGISHGAQPIIGYNRGAGHYLRIRKTLEKAIIAATTIVVVGFVVTLLIPKQLISMFGNEPDFIRFGVKAIRIWFLLLPVVGCQTIGAMYFQAVGKPKVSLFLTMTRQLLFLIPAILVLSSFFGMEGILYAAPVSDGISFLVTGIFLLYEIRRLNRLISVESV